MRWTCLFRFNFSENHPRYSRWVNCAEKTVSRMNGIQVRHHISSVKPITTFPWQSQECKQPHTKPKLWTIGSEQKLWVTTSPVWKHKVPEWLQPLRKDWRGDLQVLQTQTAKVLYEDQESRLHHRCVVVVQDLATQWIQQLSMKNPKSAEETQRNPRELWRQEENPRSMNSDTSLLLHCSLQRAELESWEINAAQIRKKWKCRASCTTLQESWWAEAMECYCFSQMCKTHKQMSRHFMNDGSSHHLMGRSFHLEQK